MKKIFILILVLLQISEAHAQSICEKQSYNRCLVLYETSSQMRQAAANWNMTKEEYCQWLAEQYCMPLDD